MLAEIKKTRLVSLVGTIGALVLAFAGITFPDPYIVGALMFPMVLFMAYNFMTAKSSQEALIIKYHPEKVEKKKEGFSE